MPNKVDYRTFSQRVKNKYPEYINMGDLELAQMWVSQNPQYGEFVMFDQQPVKKKDQAAPSLGEPGGLQYASTGDPIADKAQAQSALKSYSQKKDKSDEIGFWENIGNNIINGSNRMWNDFTQTGYEFGMISRGVPIAGAQALGKTARPFKEDYKTKTRQEMGLLEESAAAFANSIPLMIGSIGLGGVAGAGVRVAGTLPMFISGFQESGREAEELGITDPLDRLTFQTIGGTIEGASEMIMPDASLIRPLRKRVLNDLVRIGGKGLSRADAGRYVAEFTEKVAKEVGEEYAVEIGNVLRNASFAAAGYDKAAPEMKSARDYAVMTLSAALGAGTFAGVGTGFDAATAKSTAIKKAAENPEAAAQAAADLVDAGKLTQEQADAFLAKVASVNRAVGKMPKDVDPDVAVNTADLLNEKVDLEESVKALEEEKNNVDPSFHQGIDDQIAQITGRINELTQQITEFQAPAITLDVERIDQAAPEAPQMAPTEVSPEVGMEIPQEDQGVLQVINSVIQPISSDIEARMNNAEEIPMLEIEAVVDALIDAQQSVRLQEGARTRPTQGGFVTEFGALSDQQKRNFDTLIEQQINKLLNYEFATITTTEQAGEKTKTAGLVATPREGRPLPESVVSRDRFDGAGVRVGGRGAGRITVKRIPGFGGRSVYGVSFGNRKGVSPVEDLEFDNLEFVAPEILADGSFNARVKDSKSGLEFTITDPELSIDLAIAAQLKEAGRKEFPQPAFLQAVREVTQGQPTQVTTFPNLGRTGTTPAAVGVEPQTEQDVRQETNAPQEGRAQGENAAPVPQEEGRQEGQVTPPDVAQEGETPPAAKRARKTEQQKADEGKAILDKLKETLRALKAKPGGGANIDLTFGVVPISKAVWNTAIDTAILAIDAGQSIAQAVKAASDYISSKIDGDWGKAKFEQYMDERFGQAPLNQQIDDVAESAGISPKNFRDLYRVNRELFGLNQSEAMSAAIAMDKMIDVMAKRAGVSKTEMYGKLNFKKATEGFAKDLSNRGKLLFQLIGENAELSQEVRNNLQTARVMEAAGESVKSIRLRTGWERGKDGKWRYEIDDSSVSLMFNMKSMSQLGKKYNLDSVLNYPELFSAYPELRKVKISISKKGGSTNEAFFDGKQIVLGIGTYDLSSYIEKLQRQEFLRNVPADILEVVNAYFENEQLFDELRKQGFSFDEALDAKMKKSPFNEEVDKMLLKSGYGETNNLFGREFITPNQKFFEIVRAIEATKKEEDRPSEFNLDLNKDLLLTTLHEIQHWIQKKEGFARGGNMVLAYEQLSAGEKSIYDDLQKKSKEKLDELDSKSLKWYEQGDDIRDIVLAPQNFLNEAYRKIAGEVEARNVEERFGMTPEQRRATTLQETEDVARDEQMVLFEKAVPQGVKFQVDAWHGSPYQFDKFKTENIGTGEGAQAFGWGLYFTDLKSIAETYAKNLSKRRYSKFLFNGKPVSDSIGNILDYFDYTGFDVNLKNIKQSLIDFITEEIQEDPAQEQRYKDEIDFIRKANVTENKSKGVVYKASINKGKASDQYTWLEWDKPVGEENAKKILAQLKKDGLLEKAEANWSRKNMGGSFSGKESLENDLKNLRGDHLYERLLSPRVTPVADGLGTSAINRLFGSAKDASLFLLSSGIDGVKYPAESIARGATSDTARGFNYVVFDENAVSIEEVIKFQKDAVKARGAMMITLDGQATIYALTDPNVSTPLHELAHVFEHYLTDGEKSTVQEWAKTEDWTIKTSEAFARGFEKYLAEGKAPTPALQKIFDNFKQWLTDIYRGIVGSDIDIELNEPMRDLYAKMFEFTGEDGKPQQQAQPEVSEQGKGKSAEEIFNSSEIFEGQTPNQARLFFADALNDFKVPYVLGQPALDPRSDMTLTLNGAKFLLSENQRGPSNYVLIDDFLVNESLLGTGKGRDALVKLIEYADKNGITLVGEPLAMDGRRKSSRKGVGLNQKDLTDFYKRYGFTKISKESLSNVATAETGFFERKPQQQAQPEAQVEATAKALDGVDTQPLKRQLGIEANWDMIGEGDVISGKDPVLAYIQKQLPSWNRESQRGNINPNSKITYDIVRGEYGGIDQKDVVEAKDENGVVIGVVKLDTKGGIENIAVAPEFRGKGVSDKLIQTLKANNPQLDLSKTKLRSKGFEKAFGNKIIAEAYHKAKTDGSNPKLVQAVEDLLGKTTPEAKPDVVKQGSRAFLESVKSAFPKRGMLGGVVITDADGTELAEASFEIKDDENIGGISNEIPKIELSSFLSLKAGSRQGFGKRALAVIKDMADKHGVQIILVPDPLRFLNIKGVNKKFLERFYGKSGFKSPHRLSPYMVYLPQTPEAKPEKTIAEQRKEFRETAKKYFDGLKKMGIAFDPERNSKEDIAFLKALAKYIKLELDAGMVTFKGFLEKTANLIEGFNEKAVVAAAKEAWAKEVVKAYPKLYAKYNAAKRKELEREIKDIRKTMIRRIMDMTEPKIVNFKSQLKTEKRRLSKEAAAQLAAIRNAYDAKTMMAMEPQDLMELLNLTEGIYKEGRSEIKALNESLDEAAQIQGEQMLEAISSKNKRLDKLESKEVARRKLANKAGIVVAIKGDDRIIMKEEKDLEALDGEGYTFLFLNTISDKAIEGNLFQNIARFFSENVRSLRENTRDLRTGLELIKSGNKQSQDFINGLVEKMNKASVEKARKEQSWSKLLKEQRKAFFGSDLNFRYTNWMQGVPKMNGKPMVLRNGGNEKIGGINNAKIVTLFRQMMDPTNLVKTKGVRKIDLSDESIRQIIDYMNLPENKAGKGFALSLNGFFEKVAMDTAATLEENGYNAKKLEPKRYNKEDFADDTFIGDIMNQLSETRTEGFIPYTPIQATESPDTVQGAQINEDDLLNPGDVQKNFSVISNNMITRKPGGVIVPTDIRQALNSYTAGMANMNAKLPILRDTQVIFSKKNLTAMSNAFAPQFAENLKSNYISFMTDRVTPVSSSKSSAAFKTWLMTSTAIPMFFNPKSALLQFLAVPNFMVSYDITRYFSASKKLISDPVLFKDLAVQIINLPTMRQRFGGRFSPDSRVVNEEMKRYGNLAITLPLTNLKISAKELLAKGYLPSSLGDIGTIAIGGAPVYYDILQRNKAKYLAQGMSEDQASARAKSDAEEKLFEIIQETQQSSEAMYLSEFQKQSFTRLFTSFATATQQYYRKARRAAARMKNKEGNQLQNAYEILHYTAINAALFQFFSSMLMDAISGPGEDELEEMSRQERMDLVRYMESIMETVAQGTGGIGVALQAIILASKEMAKSGKPEKVLESVLRTMPAARIKYDAGLNALREWKRGDYVRAFTKGGEVANIPTDRIRALVVQVSEALTENLEAQERIARITSFRTESWMREKREREIWNGVQSAVDKSTPAERQRAISNTKSAYRDLFQLYGKRYAEATTEAEKARVDSIASKELLNVYNHRQGGPEFTEELQKLFNQSAEFNSLPKDMQKLKNMETNRKIGDVVEEVLSLEKKSEQKAMEYWSSLVNNGILSKNEIERVREEYNTRKGLQ